MLDMQEVKQYLKDEVGNDWFKDISETEVMIFIQWACECQTFRRTAEDPDWMTIKMGNAFRGFVIGLQTGKGEMK